MSNTTLIVKDVISKTERKVSYGSIRRGAPVYALGNENIYNYIYDSKSVIYFYIDKKDDVEIEDHIYHLVKIDDLKFVDVKVKFKKYEEDNDKYLVALVAERIAIYPLISKEL